MGKAIRNFKDALSGIEEAKYRRIEENGQPPKPQETPTVAAVTDPQPGDPTDNPPPKSG